MEKKFKFYKMQVKKNYNDNNDKYSELNTIKGIWVK